MKGKSIFNEVLAHFLTVFPVNSPPRRLELYVRENLEGEYAAGVIDDFVEKSLARLQSTLVTEFNERSPNGDSIRFSFADDDGTIVQGIGGAAKADLIAFQDGINSLTASEFETFSAHILSLASCDRYWRTQETHDEGLDAFGYMPYFRIKSNWVAGKPEIVFLAQAKHYIDCKVGSADIREFVGTSRLAMHKIYSKIDDRYNDLEIKPFAPIALVFVTSQEVPRTVKNMGRAAGIVVLTSDDLFRLFLASRTSVPGAFDSSWVAAEIRAACAGIPLAR